jgi:membrane protease YdiL (CAAX protease family)
MSGLRGGFPELSPQLATAIFLALGVVGLVCALIDVVLIHTWISDSGREKPLLARRWSVAHVFLGLQAWIALTLVIGTPAMVVLMLLLPPDHGQPQRVMALAALPMLIIQNLAMAAVVALFVRLVYREPLSAAGFSTRRLGHYLALGAGLAVVVVPISDLVERLSALAIDRTLPQHWNRFLAELQQLTDVQEMLFRPLHTPLGLVALVLVIGIIGPLGEEIFFRGFAYTALRHRFGPALAAVGSAAFFAAVHLNPGALIPIFLMGLLLAALYQRTGTLAAPFALHAANNTFAVILAYYYPKFSFWSFLPGP